MGMSAEREEYFMGEMRRLADLFAEQCDEIKESGIFHDLAPEAFEGPGAKEKLDEYVRARAPDLLERKNQYLRQVNGLSRQFDEEAGPSAAIPQWNALMQKSGAVAIIEAALQRCP